jgi:alkylhydroperoxidase family enzyme
MSRITEPDDAALPFDVREILADEAARHGAPLNTTKVLARHPELLRAFHALSRAMRGMPLIPPALRYLVYLRVASLVGCPF